MMRTLVCLTAFLMPSLLMAQGTFPREVQRFFDRREGCDHMRGELPDPGEKQRMREVSREIRKLCTGTDKELDRLKKKYAIDPVITQRLEEFEPDIEPKKAAVR